jgi:DNA-binding NtrC family response regulator
MARILVVDDEDVVRSLLRTILKHDGHEVVEAGDGFEAIRIHTEKPADLVIVDLVMPKKHGLDTILEMREHHPETRFIVMTGALPSLLDSENMATMLGDALTIAKPMTPPDLLRTVQEALEPAEA